MKIVRNIENKALCELSNSFIEFYGINVSDAILELSREFPINESSEITFYELRKLLLVLIKYVKDPVSKNVLDSILKAMTYLEIRNVPIPTLLRQLSKSTKVFKQIKGKKNGKN